ncbi:hypothetical protein WG66_008141 [Moniliophthora roreri]|nr:hypothetical protein WG66_008141 [Moniliophthora roreri]
MPDEEFNELSRKIKIPKELSPSNQVGEMLAVKELAEKFPPVDLMVISDSNLTKYLQENGDKGYIGMENADLLKVTTAQLRAHKVPITFQWVKRHSGIEGNERADQMANKGREKEQPDIIDMDILPTLQISGVKLSKVTQSL